MMERITQPQLRHLFARAAFGATPAQLQDTHRQPVRKVVRQLLADSQTFEPLQMPLGTDDANPGQPVMNKNEAKQLMRDGVISREQLKAKIKMAAVAQRDINVQWINHMATSRAAMREKMALFWHNHFACRINQKPKLVLDYVNVLRQHALGNFGEMLLAVSKTPAMLQFLNNQQNRKNAPNENFAREVMELFTLGKSTTGTPHYTEHDVKEAARAFTGWQFTPDGEFVFRERVHDDGAKTLFGQTGTFRGDDVLQLLLKNPQTARHVTTKIYREFVNETVNSQHVDELSRRFYKSNYDIADLMEAIFTADWFFDPANVGAHIKSPVELLIGMRHTFGMVFSDPQPQVFIQRTLGQLLLYPPNVAGWPGGRNWIDSSSLLFRMRLPEYVFKNVNVPIRPKDDGDVNLQPLDRKGAAQFTTLVDWAGFQRPYLELTNEAAADSQLPEALAACLLPWPLHPDQKALLLRQLKPGQSGPDQIRTLATAMMTLPEYQLC
ncbi:DUF1800 family protein [Fibrella sp. WM1]|uniref:DUF1800 domain-containing protein n=1 Tax=Fibrella musci TaxID=3242485 RepID=UPI00351FECDE